MRSAVDRVQSYRVSCGICPKLLRPSTDTPVLGKGVSVQRILSLTGLTLVMCCVESPDSCGTDSSGFYSFGCGRHIDHHYLPVECPGLSLYCWICTTAASNTTF